MKKRPLTVGYILFYILFWPDTYRIAMGVCGALVLSPYIATSDSNPFQSAMVHVMVAGIGYAISAKPANSISKFFQSRILGAKK